ncbi:putative mitochondrial protein AtMg00310 [Apium graveolens]|uniref:putative mitochondrial protein AtMg00310 n=1 Tax=Apium graveolens TaxID=4045 RepID=UPI003D7A3E65
MNKFWWLSNVENKGIRWMCWDRLCAPKKFGGMGFRKIRQFNVAMLGKQFWRLMTEPQSLITRLLKARYYPTVSIQEATRGHNSSYVWRSILEARDLVISGSRYKVGSGESIKVWTDPWLPDDEGPLLLAPAHSELQNIMVSSLLCPENNRWDMDVLQDIFAERDIQRILRIPRGSGSNDDSWMWIDDEKGLYTVKTGYR